MGYMSVAQAALKWGVTDRVVRQYCADGRVPGAFITGKTWNIPDDAEKPARRPRARKLPDDVLGRLRAERENDIPGGIYHDVQIELAYNSNHIEGSRLTHDQTRLIFETNTIDAPDGTLRVDDIVETANHFRCVDLIIDQAERPLTETLIKQLHLVLKNGTEDSRKGWFAVGGYKRYANEVGNLATTPPAEVAERMRELVGNYRALAAPTLDDLLDFHVKFELIHPFQDGNGRVGRLILFKEALRCHITPFIIGDDMKFFYYRGIAEWPREKGYLRDTCLTAQDRMKARLDYFGIEYGSE